MLKVTLGAVDVDTPEATDGPWTGALDEAAGASLAPDPEVDACALSFVDPS